MLPQAGAQPQCSDLLHSPLSLEPHRTWHLSGVTPGSCARWLSWRHHVHGDPSKVSVPCALAVPSHSLISPLEPPAPWPGAQGGAQLVSSRASADFIMPFSMAPKQTALSQASPFGKHSCSTFQVHPSVFPMQQRSWNSTLCLCASHPAL